MKKRRKFKPIFELCVFLCAGNEKIIRTIIQNNATNINAIDADGHTALDAVVTSSESKYFNYLHFVQADFCKKGISFHLFILI